MQDIPNRGNDTSTSDTGAAARKESLERLARGYEIPTNRKRFQFSLKQLLAWTTAAAVLCALLGYLAPTVILNAALLIIYLAILVECTSLTARIMHNVPEEKIGLRYLIAVFATSFAIGSLLMTIALAMTTLVAFADSIRNSPMEIDRLGLFFLSAIAYPLGTMLCFSIVAVILAAPLIGLLRWLGVLTPGTYEQNTLSLFLIPGISFAPLPVAFLTMFGIYSTVAVFFIYPITFLGSVFTFSLLISLGDEHDLNLTRKPINNQLVEWLKPKSTSGSNEA